jgi:hypothetical protein
VIKWWIASGREMDLGESGNENNDAIGGARKEESWMSEDLKGNKIKVISLLERFRDHPEEARHGVRVEFGWFDEMAAELFALVVFLCDGLLELKDDVMIGASRFFRMAKELPMELQVILCYRVVGSTGQNIPGEKRELAFKLLAR